MTDFRAMIWQSVRGKELGRPVTMNDERKQGHWGGRAGKTAIWRRASAHVFRQALDAGELVPVEVVTVQFIPTYLRGPFPDVAAVAPTVKAVVDGMVDAGVIPDDNLPHLDQQTFLRPRIGTTNGLTIRVIEGSPLDGHPYGQCDCRAIWEAQQTRRKEQGNK